MHRKTIMHRWHLSEMVPVLLLSKLFNGCQVLLAAIQAINNRIGLPLCFFGFDQPIPTLKQKHDPSSSGSSEHLAWTCST